MWILCQKNNAGGLGAAVFIKPSQGRTWVFRKGRTSGAVLSRRVGASCRACLPVHSCPSREGRAAARVTRRLGGFSSGQRICASQKQRQRLHECLIRVKDGCGSVCRNSGQLGEGRVNLCACMQERIWADGRKIWNNSAVSCGNYRLWNLDPFWHFISLH